MSIAAKRTSESLYPGVSAGPHVNPQEVMNKLRSNGIDLRSTRNSGMRELVRAMAPALAATQFGYRAQTTERHARISGATWSTYPALHQEPST